jgi:UDP-hydrolysing UDP-N-acetyl-D-glucosamine 2-epimerase
MHKICLVLTARPSYAKIQTILDALPDAQLVVAGAALLERYGAVADTVSHPVAARVYSVVEGSTPETDAIETGLLGERLASVFAQLRPDVVLTVADRHETLATAMAAAYMNIPLAHLQGGERTGSIDDKVRDAVSMLADIHFPATVQAGVRLSQMGVRGPIHVTGCPSIDLCTQAVYHGWWTVRPTLVMQHPVSGEDPVAQIDETIAAIQEVNPPHVLWFWPGEDAGCAAMAKRLRLWHETNPPNVTFKRNLSPATFLNLLANASVVVGNSSCGIREASYLGTPVVNIGTRQTGRERGENVVDVAPNKSEIVRGWQAQWGKRYPPSSLYGDGQAGQRVAEILCSMS